MSLTGIEQDTLGGCCLPGVDVGNNPYISILIKWKFACHFVLIYLMIKSLISCHLDTVMGESAVRFSHLMRLIAFTDRGSSFIGGIDQLGSQFVGKRTTAPFSGRG